ncbi:MAG TPA: dynamin family protein [Candidatus Acidoferrales bacterium]|nr:dynamin family protein [Candidatus Acidoferrales bacterium]
MLLGGESSPAWPGREADLAALDTMRERLDQRFTLAVVGEFSSGKSYLLNALLGRVRRDGDRVSGLLAVDINPSTATITELEYAAEEQAIARYESGRRERVPLGQLARFVAVGDDAPGALHDATADDDTAPTHVVVQVPSPFLRRGFVVADTPGLASLNPAHRRATLGYLPRTDAVLYLIDTQQPFTEGDAAFLGLIGEHVRTIFIVQTKIDLWRMRESNGHESWENAHERIAARAAMYAPNAEVFAVSARDYAVGQIDDDPELRERSGFPALLRALDRSLQERVAQARVARAASLAHDVLTSARIRVQRLRSLIAAPAAEIEAEYTQAAASLAHREEQLERERDEVMRRGAERATKTRAQGVELSASLTRALANALDIADIERIADRGKMHALVDATAATVFGAFAQEIATGVAEELSELATRHRSLRVADFAAVRLGGEPGAGAWSRDLVTGIRSTIVLEGIGGPTVAFVHAIGSAFAAHVRGRYMKRELGSDLRERLFPRLEADVAKFVDELAGRLEAVYGDAAAALDLQRRNARADILGPIEAARALTDPQTRNVRDSELLQLQRELETLLADADRLEAQKAEKAPVVGETVVPGAQEIPFNTDVYHSGLRPQRWRVVVLAALRRGKSSLINAISGTRLLQDEGAREAIFPIHVRYGDQTRAYAQVEGEWHVIPLESAMTQAASSPILIEVPWKMPRELVLVHAPAFDSGNPQAQEIALAAAEAASEVLVLFSRQLSEHELALYARVAALGKPMLFAHTIADNESAAERRTVVELAGRYLRKSDIPYKRIFTVSALDFDEAALAQRAPLPWNELGALRDTLASHAEEHMRRLARRSAKTPVQRSQSMPANPPLPSAPPLQRALDRLFGRTSQR